MQLRSCLRFTGVGVLIAFWFVGSVQKFRRAAQVMMRNQKFLNGSCKRYVLIAAMDKLHDAENNHVGLLPVCLQLPNPIAGRSELLVVLPHSLLHAAERLANIANDVRARFT